MIIAGFAACLLCQLNICDGHAAIDGLGHVIDCQAGQRNGSQRFHLDAGLPLNPRQGTDAQSWKGLIRLNFDGNFCQKQRVAERDQLMGALGSHDAGNARRAENITLFGIAFQNGSKGLRLHDYRPLRNGAPLRFILVADIDHVGFAGCTKMGEAGHGLLCRLRHTPTDQGPGGCCNIVLAHQAFTDKECRNAAALQSEAILMGEDTAFTDNDTI